MKRLQEQGNGIVEMVLFTPLAMFFLFLVTDAGMALHDRSGVIDAARAAVLAHPKELAKLESYDAESGFEHADQLAFLDAIAGEIESAVRRARRTSENVSPVFVRIALVRLDFDPATGALQSYAVERPDAARNIGHSSSCAGVALDDSVRAALDPELALSQSTLVLPLARGFHASSERFLDRRFLLAAQICGRSRGITGNLAGSVLGRFFEFHEEQLLPLRIQPRQT